MFERDPDWWARELPTGKGTNNFDRVRIEYFRDSPWRWRRSRPARSTCGRRTSRRTGPPPTISRRCSKGLVIKHDFRHHLPTGHAGLRDEHAPPGVRRSAGAPGDGPGLRLRVGQQEPVLRRLHAHRQLFQQQRPGVVRHAAGRRAEAAGAVPQGTAAGAVHQAVQAAGHRRLRQQPRAVDAGAGAAGAGGLGGEGPQAGRCRRPADALHHPAGRPVATSAWRCPMCRTSQQAGHRRAGAHGRSGAVPAPDRRLRLRHDHHDLPAKATSRATSCATTGPAPRPRRRAATTCPACATRRWMR